MGLRSAGLASRSRQRLRCSVFTGSDKTVLMLLAYSVLTLSLFSAPLETFDLNVQIRQSQVRPLDMAVVSLIGVWTLLRLLGRVGQSPRLVWILGVLLTLPVLTAVAAGKSFFLIARDVRTPMFHIVIAALGAAVRRERDVRRLWGYIGSVAGLGFVLSATAWFVALRSGAFEAAEGYRRYGVASLNAASALFLAFCVAMTLFGTAAMRYRLASSLVAALLLVQMCVFNDSRSQYVATAVLIAFLIGASAMMPQRRVLLKRRMFVRLGIMLGAVAIVAIAVLIGLGVPMIGRDNYAVKRIRGLVDPAVDPGSSTNRQDRLNALTYGWHLGTKKSGFGLGYGDNPFTELPQHEADELLMRNNFQNKPGNAVEGLLLFHNAYAWALGRLGLWVAIGYFIVIALILVRGYKAAQHTGGLCQISVLAAIAFAMFCLAQGFGGGVFFDYFGPGVIPWSLALAIVAQAPSYAVFRNRGRIKPTVFAESRGHLAAAAGGGQVALGMIGLGQ